MTWLVKMDFGVFSFILFFVEEDGISNTSDQINECLFSMGCFRSNFQTHAHQTICLYSRIQTFPSS